MNTHCTPRRQARPPRWLLPGTAALLLAASAGCGRHEPGRDERSLPPARVRVRAVEQARQLDRAEVTGSVEASQRASLSAKVSGAILELNATPGQRVKRGDLIVALDAREMQARRDETLALRDQAKSDFARYRKLMDDKAITQQEFDQANSRLKTAEARLVEAETMLGYVRILAPFDGVITRKLAEVGDLATPGRALAEIENDATLQFAAQVDEALAPNVKLGDRLEIQIERAGAPLQAQVAEIAPSANPASRTFLVKLALPAAPDLRAGQFGRLMVPVAESASIRVPAGALVRRGQLEMVFAAVDGRAVMHLVKTGRRDGASIEIVSGIDPGERIVVEGATHLRDGQPLEIAE